MQRRTYCLDELKIPRNHFFHLPFPWDAAVSWRTPINSTRTQTERIHLASEISPPWLGPAGTIELPVAMDAAELPAGRVLARWGERDEPAVVAGGGEVFFAFDPVRTLAAIFREDCLPRHRPLMTWMPFHYQRLPGPLRFFLHRFLASRSAENDANGFPGWPIDPAVEALRWLAVAATRIAAGRKWSESASLWPGAKRFAVALTHDIDTAHGFAAAPAMAAIEEELGLRSGWAVVGQCFARGGNVLGRLTGAGHEILLHDYNHDLKLAYLSRAAVERRLDACASVVEKHRIRGFRSPAFLTSPALDEALAGRFAWSSSTIDADVGTLVAARRGVGTVFPFFKGPLLELPVTAPLDDRLLALGFAGDDFVKLLLSKIDWIAEVGGMALLANHPEPHLSGNPRMMKIYRQVLEALAARQDAWFALPSAIADHWRALGGLRPGRLV